MSKTIGTPINMEEYVKRNDLIIDKLNQLSNTINRYDQKLEDFILTPLGLCTQCKKIKK